MLAQEHPEMRLLVADCKRMTLLERFRKRAEAREEVRAEPGQVIQELERKLREAGIDT